MNQRKLLVGFIAILVIVVLASVALRDSPGKAELKRWQAAENSAQSWRIATTISRNGMVMLRRTHEAVCPDREHITEQAGFDSVEYIRIADDTYYRQGRKPWTKGKPSPDLFFPFPTPRPCMSDSGQPSSQPGGGAEESRLALQNDLQKGTIEKGAVRQLGGGSCRDWKVMVINPTNRMGSYTACISEVDHLPRQLSAVNESLTLDYNWDVPVTVDAPDMNLPPAITPPVNPELQNPVMQ